MQEILDTVNGWIADAALFAKVMLSLVALGLVLAALKALIFHTLRRFGLASPWTYEDWPRLPWRRFLPLLIRIDRYCLSWLMGKRQTAKWSGPLETLGSMYRPGKLFLGRFTFLRLPWWCPIGISPEKHCVIVAETGSGKTTGMISMASLHRGSLFAIDPAGQMARCLYVREGAGDLGLAVHGKGNAVAVLDPNSMLSGITSASWNPFDEIAHLAELERKRSGNQAAHDIVATFADIIAEGVVRQDSQTQPVFANISRSFVKALVLHVYTKEPAERRNLMTLRRYLTRGIDVGADRPELAELDLSALELLFMEMETDPVYDAIPEGIATVKAEVQKNSGAAAYLSSAIQQTEWMNHPALQRIMGSSSFHLSDLKRSLLSLFVCADVSDIRGAFSGWFRLLTVFGVRVFEKERSDAPSKPCLFMVDEMPSLGKIEAFGDASKIGRKYGLRLVVITQNLKELAAVYPDTWETFLGGSSAVLWLAAEHQGTLEYLERKLGGRTLKDGHDRPLAYAQQLETFLKAGGGNMIVTNTPRPMMLRIPPYYTELAVSEYAPDPAHGDSRPRHNARRFLSLAKSAGDRLAGFATSAVRWVNCNIEREWCATLITSLCVLTFLLLLRSEDGGLLWKGEAVSSSPSLLHLPGRLLLELVWSTVCVAFVGWLVIGVFCLLVIAPIAYGYAFFLELSGRKPIARAAVLKRRESRLRCRRLQNLESEAIYRLHDIMKTPMGGLRPDAVLSILGMILIAVMGLSLGLVAYQAVLDSNQVRVLAWLAFIPASLAGALLSGFVFSTWIYGIGFPLLSVWARRRDAVSQRGQ
ncbi:MAG: type IV secretory system conjugative DNA transfer family protein [Phycisphaerales bacterium]|nr:type IV secretory system conjugative DNA transfer family protein [Phycisphaerales bacterium]MCB9836060.1 type IV secretory system conjugative DNA transfer family protein [Phycisphaera sp.]